MGENTDNQVDDKLPIGADRSVDLATEQGNPAPITQPSRHYKWPWVLLVAITLVLLTIAYAFITLQPKETVVDPLAAATKFASPQELITTAKPELNGVVLVPAETDGVGAITADGYIIYSAPSYHVADTKFLALPQVSSGTGYVGDSVSVAANYKRLTSFFSANKFRRITERSNTIGAASSAVNATYVSYAEYESSNLVCAIRHVDASQTEVKAHIASLGCASKDSYKSATKVERVFYDVYSSGSAETNDDLVFGMPKIIDNKDGSQNATVYQEDKSQFNEGEDIKPFYGLYYRESKEGKWQFFTGMTVDEIINCSSFNTPALKKAFVGVECHDEVTDKDVTFKS